VRTSSSLAVTATFTALIVGSDFALAPFANVKLLDTVVFVVAFVFGFRIGAAVAVLSETVWSSVSPWGMGGAITPFLVGGELLFVFAGYATSKLWEAPERLPAFSAQNLYFGAILSVCAFVWDFETNIATGLIAGAQTLASLLTYEVFGIPFTIAHELSDFVLGSALAPIVIVYSWRVFGRRAEGITAKTAIQVPQAGSKVN
jgi:hypothetical protein